MSNEADKQVQKKLTGYFKWGKSQRGNFVYITIKQLSFRKNKTYTHTATVSGCACCRNSTQRLVANDKEHEFERFA